MYIFKDVPPPPPPPPIWLLRWLICAGPKRNFPFPHFILRFLKFGHWTSRSGRNWWNQCFHSTGIANNCVCVSKLTMAVLRFWEHWLHQFLPIPGFDENSEMEEGDLGVRHGASHHHKVKDRLVSLKRPAILTCQGDIKKEFFFQIFICNSHNTHLKEYRSTENY